MTTTTKNGQINRQLPGHKSKPRTKTGSRKNPQIDKLNYLLEDYAELTGLPDIRAAARKLDVPLCSGKATSKQIPGYIGLVKAAIRKLKQK